MGKNTSPPPVGSAKSNGKKKGFHKPGDLVKSPKMIICGVEGFGKTTIAANIPNVALICADTETGYETLYSAGRVPGVKYMVTSTWGETMDAIKSVPKGAALALDELSGFERQCHAYVRANEFDGSMTSFMAYHKGFTQAVHTWMKFLNALEQLGALVVALSHCTIETFKDPMNQDHDRYVAALNKNTWGVTRRWADAVLFGCFKSVVDKKTGKGQGGVDRILYTEHRDTHDAKNRYGMDYSFALTTEPEEGWGIINDQIEGNTEDD